MPADRTVENNYILQTVINDSKARKRDAHIMMLDLSSAFTSISHSSIMNALKKYHAGQEFRDVIEDIMKGNTTAIKCAEGETNSIHIHQGIKQGCPISGPLFILAINRTLQKVQDNQQEHKILAYADDVTLIARTADHRRTPATA